MIALRRHLAYDELVTRRGEEHKENILLMRLWCDAVHREREENALFQKGVVISGKTPPLPSVNKRVLLLRHKTGASEVRKDLREKRRGKALGRRTTWSANLHHNNSSSRRN